MFVSMATNVPVRKRVVVKSKRPAKSSDGSTTDSPSDLVDGLKASAGPPPILMPRPSSPCKVTVTGGGVLQMEPTLGNMEKQTIHETPLPVVLQQPRLSSSQPPLHHPPPGSRKKEDTSSSSSSSDNERDEVFVNHPRQVFFIAPGSHLSPVPHYNHSFTEPAGYRMYGKGKKNRVAPMTPARLENSQRTPSPYHHSHHNTWLSSSSPHDDLSTISSFSASSPLPPLLTANMRRGGGPYQDSSALLESLLPGKMLKVFVGTWNMCGQKELPESLNDFLLPLSQSTAADLYVIATQESTANRQEWEVLMQQTLGPTHVLVHSVTLGVLYLILFLRRDLIWYCSVVRTSSYATRPVTLIRTKGGVGLSFTLFGSSFLFINSHLSAGQDNVSERNSDIHRITRNLSFGSEPVASAANSPATPTGSSSSTVTESHDHVFWCGDLNYRLEMERKEVNQLLSQSNLRVSSGTSMSAWTCQTTPSLYGRVRPHPSLQSLLLHDQLTREILGGEVFQGYSEQPISFQPTYKYDLFSDKYDSSELQRIPSWTDRVLFKSSRKGSVVGCGYNCCSSIKCSDHRPVLAVFKARLNPCNELDGMPANPVSYNRELYIRGLKRRKKAASVSAALVQANALSKKQHGGRVSRSVREQNSSAVCVVL